LFVATLALPPAKQFPFPAKIAFTFEAWPVSGEQISERLNQLGVLDGHLDELEGHLHALARMIDQEFLQVLYLVEGLRAPLEVFDEVGLLDGVEQPVPHLDQLDSPVLLIGKLDHSC